MSYQFVHSSVQGHSHIKHNQPCEDSGVIRENNQAKIFVVADGHGDSNCPRSAFGADTICQIASEELEVFAESIEKEGWSEWLFDEKQAEKLVRHLITSIVGKWSEKVNQDYSENPFTEDERQNASRYIERYDRGERIEHIYGTTMIAGLMTKEYLLLLQQGDGRMVVFDWDGNVSQPVPWDDRCFANVTTSMCDIDVIASVRYYVIDLERHPIAACFAGSDGVEDSFYSMEQMHSYYRQLLLYAHEHSVDELNQWLDENLPEFSKNGSGDDTTICGLIDEERISTLIPYFEKENERESLQSRLRRIDEKLLSMESGKMEYLKQQYEKAKTDIEKAEKEYREYVSLYEDLMKEKNELQESIDSFIKTEKEQDFEEITEAANDNDVLEKEEKDEHSIQNT